MMFWRPHLCTLYCLCIFTIANSDDRYLYVYIYDVVFVASVCSVNLSVMMPNQLLHSTIKINKQINEQKIPRQVDNIELE